MKQIVVQAACLVLLTIILVLTSVMVANDVHHYANVSALETRMTHVVALLDALTSQCPGNASTPVIDADCDTGETCKVGVSVTTGDAKACETWNSPVTAACTSACYLPDEDVQAGLRCNGAGVCTGTPAECLGKCDMVADGWAPASCATESWAFLYPILPTLGWKMPGLPDSMIYPTYDALGFCYGDSCIGYNIFVAMQSLNDNQVPTLENYGSCLDLLDPAVHGAQVSEGCIATQYLELGPMNRVAGFLDGGGTAPLNTSWAACLYRYTCAPINMTAVEEHDEALLAKKKRVATQESSESLIPAAAVVKFLHQGRPLPPPESNAWHVTHEILRQMNSDAVEARRRAQQR